MPYQIKTAGIITTGSEVYKDESLNQISVDFYKSFLSFRKSTIWKSTNRTI